MADEEGLAMGERGIRGRSGWLAVAFAACLGLSLAGCQKSNDEQFIESVPPSPEPTEPMTYGGSVPGGAGAMGTAPPTTPTEPAPTPAEESVAAPTPAEGEAPAPVPTPAEGDPPAPAPPAGEETPPAPASSGEATEPPTP
jgi:hypothetical protein